MKDLKAFLAVGVAMATLSSCSSDRPSYPTYGNPNGPVPVRYSKDGAHRAYDGENGRVGPSSAQGTSMYDNQNGAVDMQNALLQLEMIKASNRPPVHFCPSPVIVYPAHHCHGYAPTMYYMGGGFIDIQTRNWGLRIR